MKTYFKLMIIPFLVLFLLAGNVFALEFGTNITIYDQNSSELAGWHGQNEDQEVEPGMAANQSWDLEGFFLNGNLLTLVGGYDFVSGNGGYTSGDIFIDINGDAVFGDIDRASDGYTTVSNSYGYDYVLDLALAQPSQENGWVKAGTYAVYQIDTNSMLETAYYKQNEGSSPWQFNTAENTNNTDVIATGAISYDAWTFDQDAYFQGEWHNAITVNLGFLGDNIDNFTAHFTMGCGNDNLMGSTAPVPEPATLLLFGTGLIGLAGIGRKRFKK